MTRKLDLTSLRDAISSLRLALRAVKSQDLIAQEPWLREVLVAGVIKNFEFVHELCAKMIPRQLEIEAQDPSQIDARNYRDILRIAAEKGIIVDVASWFGYRELRNETAHTYNHIRANAVAAKVEGFLVDAESLLLALESRNF